MGICNGCNYGKNHICPEQNVYRTVCSFKDPNRKANTKISKETTAKKENEVKNTSMNIKKLPIIRKKDLAICEDYKSGMAIDELTTKYKVHRTTITNILKKCDVPIKNSRAYVPHVKSGSISEETINAVIKEFEKGTFDKEIGKRFGLTKYRVYKLKQEWRKNKDAVKPVVEEVAAVEIKPENKHYIYYTGKTKPSSMFAPAELNDELVWAAEIKSLDDIFAVAEGAGVGTYEVKDGNLFASGQIVLTNSGITINPTAVAKAVDASIGQARTHAVI